MSFSYKCSDHILELSNIQNLDISLVNYGRQIIRTLFICVKPGKGLQGQISMGTKDFCSASTTSLDASLP